MTEAVVLTVSKILADLKSGLTRKAIGEKYGLNGVQVKELFKNPKLKHKKTAVEKGAAFVLVDDTEEVTSPVQPEVATPTPEPIIEQEVINETGQVIDATIDEIINIESLGQTVVEEPTPENISGDRPLWT
jgi:hypothetical protein